MLQSYPPPPWHLTGFDAVLMYASLDDPEHDRAERIVRALRRESLRRGARLSAAKCLHTLYSFVPPPYRLRLSRKLTLEAPGMRTYYKLALSERAAGHSVEAAVAARQTLRLAERAGDLDEIEDAQRLLSAAPATALNPFRRQLDRAGNLNTNSPVTAYAVIRRLKVDAMRRGGRATAVECVRSLLTVAALAQDTRAGLRFARELATMETSSFSSLALALALERVRRMDEARETFAESLRLARREGDLHRATKATAGLLRTRSEGLVTKAELRWTMPEARREPNSPPDYRFLRATLGFVGVGR